jgi:predicted ATPase/DNA-binding winged helix-turn-helix (wHTH) protein
MRYSFSNCLLDVGAMQLRVEDQLVPLQPQVFDVLRVLIEERDRVVTKEELLQRVWGHTFVTESALTSRIKSARQAIGDDGKSQRLIRTVHGRGYQFIGAAIEPVQDRALDERGMSHGLPRFGTTLVGREADVAAVTKLLSGSRLLTVVGPGGVGKTRLAVAVAEWSSAETAFVDLAPIDDPSLVPSQIASAVGLHANEALPDHGLAEYFAGREALLVIDNAEHVIDAAVLIGELVRSVPDLTVIVTSRERLRVGGEQVYHLEPLDVEGDADASNGLAPAVALFAMYARAVDPDFDLDRFRPDVERICRAVDGLPLAIELVAAQTGTLPPDMLASRLREGLRSSSAARRDAPTRQRTMADTIEWGLQLITASELMLFGRLGAFSGDVTVDAIEAVCRDAQMPDPIDVLGRLVDCSLVRRTFGKDGVVRFGMLDLLRHRAAELLREDPAGRDIERRHREYVAGELWNIDQSHLSGIVTTWIDRITALRDEARRAFSSAVASSDWATAGRIAGSLTMYHHREGGLAEGRRWLEQIEPHESELSEPVLGRVLLGQGLLAWDTGDLRAARAAWEEALVVLQRAGDEPRSAFVLASLAVANLDEPAVHDRCRALIDRGVALARRVAQPVLLAEVLNIAGEFARATGDDPMARPRYEEAFELASRHRDQTLVSITLANLAYLACHDGDFDEGRRIGRQALEMCWELKRRQLAAWSVGELAGPATELGDPELAARLIGASQRALEVQGGRIYPADRAEHERIVARTVEALGATRFDELRTEGRALTLDDAIALALGRER